MRSGDPVYSSTRWRKLRAVVLAEEPVCSCGHPSTRVDHRIPHRGDPVLMWDRANLRGQCERCHNAKTAATDCGFGNPRRTTT